MDKRKQIFVIKFLWFQGLGETPIHAQLSSTLAGTALSLSTVQRRLCRFNEGNTSCEDVGRLGRLVVIIGDILRKFLARYPFASAKLMSRHFGVNHSKVKEVLSCELGFRKHAQRWVTNLLDGAQKNHRRASATKLFELLRGREAYDFDVIATGDESWFHYHYEPHEMFVAPREKVTPFVRTQLRVHKVMITVFLYIYNIDCQ